jgi:hypothetical protein
LCGVKKITKIAEHLSPHNKFLALVSTLSLFTVELFCQIYRVPESYKFLSITSLLLNAFTSAYDRHLDVICEELHQCLHWLLIFVIIQEYDAVNSPSLFQTSDNQTVQDLNCVVIFNFH